MRFPWMAALYLATAAPALARDYQVDDVLRLESYGQVLIDPTSHWAVVERRGRYDSAPTFRYTGFTERLVSTLYVADLTKPGDFRPLFRQDDRAGYWSGGFSPSGRRMIVFRMTDNRLSTGVLDMATRSVRWLPLIPDLPDAHPSPLWRDEDHLLMVTLRDGGLPAIFRTSSRTQQETAKAWQAAAEGKIPTVTVLGTGRYLTAGERYRDREIVEIDLATGKQRSLLRDDVLDLALSHDGRWLAVFTRGPMVQPDPAAAVDPAFEPRRQRLAVVDLQTGSITRPCGMCDTLPSLLDWSGQGAQLVYFARKDGTQWPQGTLWRYDASTGRVASALPAGLEAVTEIDSSSRFVRGAWAGDRLLVYARPTGAKRADWYAIEADRKATALTAGLTASPPSLAGISDSGFVIAADGGLWRGSWSGKVERIPGDGAVASGLTRFDPHSLGTREWMNDFPRSLVAIGRDNNRSTVFTDDFHGNTHRYVLPSPGKILATGRDGGSIVYTETERGTGMLVLVTERGSTPLDHINTWLADVEPARRVLLHTRTADGSLLNHWLTLPAHAGTQPPPLVVVPYGGFVFGETTPSRTLASFPDIMTHPLLLAGQGFAVLQPSIPLGDAPSDPFEEIKGPVFDAIAAARATGLVSRSKPLLLGHSFGAYNVMALAASSPHHFAAVIADDGPYDLAAGYGVPDPRVDTGESGFSLTIPVGWFENGQGRMGSPPWHDPERYRRNSPFYHLEQFDTPAMLVAGDLDYVPVSQAEHLFAALYRLGKDAKLLRYTGESHFLGSPANARHYWSEVFAFLHAHEADEQPPGE